MSAAARPGGVWGRGRLRSRDVLAGMSVALVAIPQSLAYAEVAGLPGFHGLYASALPLVAAAFFASCPYLQTGPVAITALLTYGALVPLAEPGTGSYVGAAALLALVVGGTRIAIGMARAGWVSYLMSEPVLRGFTSGAALLILLSQVPGAVGVEGSLSGPVQGAFGALLAPESWDTVAIALAVLTVAVLKGAQRIHPLLPGTVFAVIGGVVFSIWSGYSGPTVGDVPAGLPGFSLSLPWRMAPQLVLPGVVIALVGFAESAAIARTFASRERAHWDPDQEFLSQGAANVVAGLVSGFPVGGSFVRSSLDQLSGAVTRWSGAVTGLTVFLFLPLAGSLSALPRAVLAGIVIGAVWGLVRPRRLAELWILSRGQAMVAWSTLAMCLLLAPRVEQAVLLGVLFSLATHVWRERRAGFSSWIDRNVLHIEAKGVLWFASAPRLQEEMLERLADARDVEEVVIHLGGLGRIDLTGALVLKRAVDEFGAVGIPSTLKEVPPHAKRIIDNVFRIPPSSFF